MIRSTSSIKGRVMATVRGPDGNIKRRELSLPLIWKIIRLAKWRFGEMFTMLKWQVSINHNIVTDEGDALVADAMSQTPARTKVDNTNGKIVVGTAYAATGQKQNTWVNTETGIPEAFEATYPKLKGAFGAGDDNVVQYRCIFEAGDLNATVDEAALVNDVNDTAADCLAYGQVDPAAVVGSSDTLQVDWELTFLGS